MTPTEDRGGVGKAAEALDWLLHLVSDVGRAGGKPEPGEWEAAHEFGIAALAELRAAPPSGLTGYEAGIERAAEYVREISITGEDVALDSLASAILELRPPSGLTPPREALEWLVNLASGVGKAGGRPEPGEWDAAWATAHLALAPTSPVAGAPEGALTPPRPQDAPLNLPADRSARIARAIAADDAEVSVAGVGGLTPDVERGCPITWTHPAHDSCPGATGPLGSGDVERVVRAAGRLSPGVWRQLGKWLRTREGTAGPWDPDDPPVLAQIANEVDEIADALAALRGAPAASGK